MRKYDGKNKRNIGIIIAICVIFAVVFSYFLFQQIKLSKINVFLLFFDNIWYISFISSTLYELSE